MDVYQASRTFELSSTLFRLLDTLEFFDENASYDVCVLQFTQQASVFHWSIYLQSQSEDEDGGPVYDVYYFTDLGRWQRKESHASEVTHMTSRWTGGRRESSSYYGGVVLGTIDDLAAFQRIIRSTPLPGRNENCQTWVEKVIRTAVKRGLLDEDALKELRKVPRAYK